MERLLNQNTYQPKQARYRCLKPLALRDIDRNYEYFIEANQELKFSLSGLVLELIYILIMCYNI
jgi:hypothetical protein